MKIAPWIPFALLLQLVACSGARHLREIQGFAPTEVLPEDTFLDSVPQKRALVIVAHDDDDCAMAGTLARLTAQGWDIRQLSLTQNHDSAGPHPATRICKGNYPLLEDDVYRLGLDTNRAPYLPITREQMEQEFLRDKITAALLEQVNAFQPTVIFTLDNVKGGYGHPEHIFISQLVVDLFQQKRITPLRIYQGVFTDHMERTIVDTWLRERLRRWGQPNASDMANALYSIDGMPAPTVQVTIRGHEQAKMDYLRAYPEGVRQNLRKFMPYYEEMDAKTYFQVFDREFFRVIR